jgi:hypothetical protein
LRDLVVGRRGGGRDRAGGRGWGHGNYRVADDGRDAGVASQRRRQYADCCGRAPWVVTLLPWAKTSRGRRSWISPAHSPDVALQEDAISRLGRQAVADPPVGLVYPHCLLPAFFPISTAS